MRQGCRYRPAKHSRHARLTSESEFRIAQKPLRPGLVHDQHHDVGLLTADLEADAPAFHTNRGRRAPCSRFAAGREPLTELGADDESALFQPGHDDHAIGFIEQVLRDAFIGRRQDFM